jgi:hypothetical protein
MISEYYEELQSVWHFNCSVYVEIEHRGGFTLRVRQRWDGLKLLRWRSDTIAKSLLFCRVATIIFSSCCSTLQPSIESCQARAFGRNGSGYAWSHVGSSKCSLQKHFYGRFLARVNLSIPLLYFIYIYLLRTLFVEGRQHL